MTIKILIVSNIDPVTIEKLQVNHNVICEVGATASILHKSIVDREILIFRSGVNITAEAMECAPNLKLLIRAGSGIDNLDVEYVRRRGLRLIRIPGPGAQAVAEMSFAFFLALSRNLLTADRSMRQGHWAKYELPPGYLLTRKTLGIIGLGNIGLRVAQLGLNWGMKIIGCVENPTPVRSAQFNKLRVSLRNIEEVVSKADYLSIHVPLKESTRNLINGDLLARMRPGSFLVNLGRGGVVEETALYKELRNGGKIRGAALDVHEKEGEGNISPLAGLSNVILTPHIGAMTIDSQREIGSLILETVDSFATSSIQGLDLSSIHVELAGI